LAIISVFIAVGFDRLKCPRLAAISAARCERYWASAANCDVEIDEIVSFG